MGFDTNDKKGPHPILLTLSNYWKPLITPKGNRVVFTNRRQKKLYVVNWDGTGLREVSEGIALDVWQEPKKKTEWVYAFISSKGKSGALYRYNIDKPQEKELVWDETMTGSFREPGWFQLSGDGTQAATAFPHPNCGIALLPNKSWRKYGNGCWTSMAPDYSHTLWIFDGPHRNVYLYPKGGPDRRKVTINTAPEIDGFEIYHPRWSNHVRIMAITGPYKVGKGGNKIGGGGKAVEVYIGRFDEAFTEIEQWVKVTDNTHADFYPDVWVEKVTYEPIRKKPAWMTRMRFTKAKVNTQGLIFLWDNANSTNAIKNPGKKGERVCNVKERGFAKYGRFYDMELAGGFIEAVDSNKLLLDACRATNELSIEALITPDNLEQGGPARIITFSSGTGSRNFTLGQQNDILVFRLRTSGTDNNGVENERNLCWLRAGVPHHVIVTYKSGHLTCYLNGKVFIPEMKVNGDFSNWTEQHFLFGDEVGGARDWAGALEHIAIFNRVIEQKEAETRYQLCNARLKKRQPVELIEIEARLVATSATPGDISPYHRCLAEYTYDVIKLLKGKCDSKKILVNHWVILDDKVLPNTRKIGKSYHLTLEPFDAHPQLESERRSIDTQDFDLPCYYDLTKLE